MYTIIIQELNLKTTQCLDKQPAKAYGAYVNEGINT